MKILSVITGIILVACIGFIIYLPQKTPPTNYHDELAKSNPTFGDASAPIHMLLIEDVNCKHCKTFLKTTLTPIMQKWVTTGKVRLSIIPVSILKGSLKPTSALFCVYYQNPSDPSNSLFKAYLEGLFANQSKLKRKVATRQLLEIAKKSSNQIDLQRLESCIAKNTYLKKVKENTNISRKILKNNLVTPSVIINGEYMKSITLENITKKFEEYSL